jgi:hypothetical protein
MHRGYSVSIPPLILPRLDTIMTERLVSIGYAEFRLTHFETDLYRNT